MYVVRKVMKRRSLIFKNAFMLYGINNDQIYKKDRVGRTELQI